MLKNKKNLLQRVRIAMLAIVTIMGVGGAFAMKAPTHKATLSYGYFSTTATGNHYIVTETAANDYSCVTPGSSICTVQSAVAPSMRNGSWELAKTQATPSPDAGTYSPN